MPKLSTRDWQAMARAIDFREDFDTHGAMKGRRGRFNTWDAGRLPSQYVDDFLSADYAIFSYATPIAFRVAGVWRVPEARYSLTTSRHQGTARTAISVTATRVVHVA